MYVYNVVKGKIMESTNSNPFKNDDIVKEEENTTVEENSENVEIQEEKSEEETSSENEYQKKYEDLNQQYIRLAADFDNFRKRQEQERSALIKYGTESALKNMLEILDNFERGAKALENVEEVDKVKESFDLIHKQVFETLSKMGLEEIKAVGEEFDPNLHEAVMQTPTGEHPEHTVITELQKGYKVGDKVLRPTMVNVATAQ